MSKNDWKTITLFCDGACKGDGVGGFAAVAMQGRSYYARPARKDQMIGMVVGGERDTTNQRMELRAALHGLHLAVTQGAEVIELVSDSQYVIQGMRDWMAEWKADSWHTKSGSRVSNLELWQGLDDLLVLSRVEIHYQHTRGHRNIPMNEFCDKLACQAAEQVRTGEIQATGRESVPKLKFKGEFKPQLVTELPPSTGLVQFSAIIPNFFGGMCPCCRRPL